MLCCAAPPLTHAVCDANEGFSCLQCKKLEDLAALAKQQSSRPRSTGGATSPSSPAKPPGTSPSPAPKPAGRHLLQAGSSNCPVGFFSSGSGVLDPETKPPPAGPAPAGGAPAGCTPCPEGSTTAGAGAQSADDCSGGLRGWQCSVGVIDIQAVSDNQLHSCKLYASGFTSKKLCSLLWPYVQCSGCHTDNVTLNCPPAAHLLLLLSYAVLRVLHEFCNYTVCSPGWGCAACVARLR